MPDKKVAAFWRANEIDAWMDAQLSINFSRPKRATRSIGVQHDSMTGPTGTIEDNPLWVLCCPDEHDTISRKAFRYLIR